MKRRKDRFPGLRLSASDRRALVAKTKGRVRLSQRTWRRIRILQLLDEDWNLADAAKAAGTFPREVRRVGWRYLERGLESALGDDPRPKPSRMLHPKQEAFVIALACTDPPEGRAKWTTALLAEEVMRQGIVKRVSKETIRRTLHDHDLKPWREKNVVRSRTRSRVHPSDGGSSGPPEQAA